MPGEAVLVYSVFFLVCCYDSGSSRNKAISRRMKSIRLLSNSHHFVSFRCGAKNSVAGTYRSQSSFFKEAKAIRHQERKLVKFPVSRLYDVVSDVDKYQEFVPWCVNSRVVSHNGNKMTAELSVGFQLLTEKYISHVELNKPNSVSAISTQANLFEYLKSEWKFTPSSSDPNATWVTFQIDFKFKLALYNELSEFFMQQVVKKMVQAFELRCKQLERNEKLKASSHNSNGLTGNLEGV